VITDILPKYKILYFVNVDWFFISHRMPIALEMQRKGYEIHVACTLTTQHDFLVKKGFIVHSVPIERSQSGIVSSIKILFKICYLFRFLKPDLLHLVTIQPVVLGGIAARLCRVPAVVAAISGLGFIFISKGLFAKIRRILIGMLYRIALNHSNIRIIFQNHSDKKTIMSVAKISEQNTILIPGSGINLNDFEDTIYAPSNDTPIILMASRLLKDKGVIEFIEAAQIAHINKINCRFVLVGMLDQDNPSALKLEEIKLWTNKKIIEYWGHQSNIIDVLRESMIVALPSYREGMPKILLEAAAAGRAVITTNVPGCKDAILENVTGLLVPPRDSRALYDAIIHLLNNREKCISMGLAGKKLAKDCFDIKIVITAHEVLYKKLLLAT